MEVVYLKLTVTYNDKFSYFCKNARGEVNLVKQVAKARGEDLSDFVRRAVYKELASLSFLSAEQQKALGIKTGVS